ncbi:MAG: sugar transferase [Pirellulales bacterium]|nr:sugar transferase [Pirellulales bacterium]
MTRNSLLRRLHAAVIRKRVKYHPVLLLSEEELQFAAKCERMRVDRNGSLLSLLLIRLPEKQASEPGVEFLARVLEGRLRITDTPGLLADGRVAVLLPDTPADGAWKLATDISEVYPPGPGRPECEVLVYPTKQPEEPFTDRAEEEVAGTRARDHAQQNGESPESDFFFVKQFPVWKRGLDIGGALLGLLASLPVLMVAGVAIKLTSRGPAFFTQQREGLGGRQFKIWKLRTMCVDAEQQKHQLQAHSHQDGPAFKMRVDPRTTSVGRFLRWSSIDELPQFWNVLKGDMSLVGPRPLPTAESMACENWQRRRLSVKPGMTCTWQVSERGNVRFDDWVRMDLRYADGYSLWEDVRLLLVTLPSLLLQKGMR